MPELRPPSLDEIIARDPECMGGEPVFRGTRVTVATVFEHLEAGLPLEEVLESWSTLDRGDVVAMLRAAHRRVLDRTT